MQTIKDGVSDIQGNIFRCNKDYKVPLFPSDFCNCFNLLQEFYFLNLL